MAKKNTPSVHDLYASLAKSIGGEVLEDSGKVPGYIDTGILALNFIVSGRFVGGGLPVGGCIEISGGSSTGKSLIGTNALRGTQTMNGIAVMHDAERTLSKDFAVKASHIDPNTLLVTWADTLEKSFNKIFKTIRMVRHDAQIPMDRFLTIVYDSIAVSPSEREFAETELDLETASKSEIKEAGAGADKPGERAKICGKELRKLTPYIKENNATVIFINQLRESIGVMWGDNKVSAGGGQALPYYCTTRIRLSSFKTIKDDRDKVIGVNVTANVVKNKVFRPYGVAKNLRLFFDKGCDPFGGLLEILLQEGRIEPAGSGFYVVTPKYAGEKELKFRSSKERNDVPTEVLLECPQLVDADSPEQIKYYLDMFGSAIVDADKIIEVESMEEE